MPKLIWLLFLLHGSANFIDNEPHHAVFDGTPYPSLEECQALADSYKAAIEHDAPDDPGAIICLPFDPEQAHMLRIGHPDKPA